MRYYLCPKVLAERSYFNLKLRIQRQRPTIVQLAFKFQLAMNATARRLAPWRTRQGARPRHATERMQPRHRNYKGSKEKQGRGIDYPNVFLYDPVLERLDCRWNRMIKLQS